MLLLVALGSLLALFCFQSCLFTLKLFYHRRPAPVNRSCHWRLGRWGKLIGCGEHKQHHPLANQRGCNRALLRSGCESACFSRWPWHNDPLSAVQNLSSAFICADGHLVVRSCTPVPSSRGCFFWQDLKVVHQRKPVVTGSQRSVPLN